jgi:uncharacterized membrane protein YoaK (UPF0700 family)
MSTAGPSSRPAAATIAPRWSPLHFGLLMLAFSAGATDAFAFLSLGGIFTGMMTGNMILIGMFTRTEYVHVLVGAVTAVVFFALGAYVGFRLLTPRAGLTDRPGSMVSRALIPSLAAQLVGAVLWIAAPKWAAQDFAVVAVLAIALSLQTVAAKKASDVMGITTTYVTGTLTTMMQDLVESGGKGNLLRALSVLSLPVGAACATALIVVAPWSALLLPLAVSAGATAVIHRAMTARR